MYYIFNGVTSSGEYQYSVTLKFFMRCASGRQFYNPAVIAVFNKKTNALITTINVPLGTSQTLNLANLDPCITNPPAVCYEVGFYYFNISLPASADGYTLASQVTYRIQGINNLALGYGQTGATYTADIPGQSEVPTAATNNSAVFTGTDLVIVCADNAFSYSFAAKDSDGDKLRYSFCNAYIHSNNSPGTSAGIPPGNPPYSSVPYGDPFSGNSPLGKNVKIDSETGLITGIAPAAGAYVVTVCVEEIRNGVVIAIQRKDLQINIAPCTVAGATLLPEYMLCKDTRTLSISNFSTGPLIKNQAWTIFDQSGTVLTTSTNPAVSYTFPDTGVYQIRLIVNQGEACSDSTTSVAKVYPGLNSKFSFDGVCFSKPTKFTDLSSTTYGNLNLWIWDFGEAAITTDGSTVQSPSYTYTTMGRKYTQLVIGNTFGCRDTVIDYLDIIDKPPLNLAFRDTLICVSDQVQLNTGASGTVSWTPNIYMTNADTKTPTVAPLATTTYYVNLNDNGCLNRDSVKVSVTDHVDLVAMNDTTICEGDTIQLRTVSNGFKYAWTPSTQLSNASLSSPYAITRSTTNYQVTATIGGCAATETITVRTVPYPFVNAGADTMICDQTSAQLHGSTTGSAFHWTPSLTLNTSSRLNPVATPPSSTTYTLVSFDNRGCPKPASDQVFVKVLPVINMTVTHDTAIVSGQPLQLEASGGVRYAWSPGIGLSGNDIANPVVTFHGNSDSIRYLVKVFNEAGCSDSDYVSVKIFRTLPSVFVPTAFTPNNDGRNDQLKPIAIGMQQIQYFNVYNRWGQLVFSTSMNKHGWDGTISGKAQNSGIYVWAVKAIDYTGKAYVQKGTAVLVR